MDANPRTNDRTLTVLYALALAVAVVLYRLAPYYLLPPGTHLFWNLVPIGALALFVGARLRGWYAVLVPLGAMLVSDLLLIAPLAERGWSSFSRGTPLIYASYAVYVLIGRLIRAGDLAPVWIGLAAVLGSVQFFLITNFGVWLNNPDWPQTPAGLLGCYTAGLPFYKNTLLGDLFFSALIFGFHAALVWTLHKQKASQPA
jgi:hypothetical protein